ILMTTIAIIAGMIPIAFGRGSGEGSSASMAVTIIGGQVLCLLLTLLVTPIVYSYFDDLREWRPSTVVAQAPSLSSGLLPAIVVRPRPGNHTTQSNPTAHATRVRTSSKRRCRVR